MQYTIIKKEIAEANGGFNTASGRYYCNLFLDHPLFKNYFVVSIPQAVGTIAMVPTAKKLAEVMNVSIPQAVGTIAMIDVSVAPLRNLLRFNTASGRYYCNERCRHWCCRNICSFNTASGRYYCNTLIQSKERCLCLFQFQYRKR